MSQYLSFDQSSHLINENGKNDKPEYKVTNEIYKAHIGEEVDWNLQTPLMFSRCSSLGSLTGFEQHSIQDDANSVISEFSPKTSRPASPPAFSQNQSLACKIYSSHNINSPQTNFSCGNSFIEGNTCERTSIHSNVSFQYDLAFKKPHFLKHSVFEDDIAAFKDESSPNLLSTATSSLSSLTIDDNDYNDISLRNKAELVKKRMHFINVLQNTHYQEYCRHDPIGRACEAERIAKADITSVHLLNHNSIIYRDEKSSTQSNFNKDALISKESKIIWNLKNNQYSRNLQDIHLKKDRGDMIKNESQCQVYKKDKFINTLQDKKSLICDTIQSKDEYKHNKNDIHEKYRDEQLEVKQKSKVFEDCYISNKRLSNYIEENNDLNDYEEQLLDQCIRRGMAKVTKKKISDIKPFCWDLNHICLTTRTLKK